MCGLLPIKGLLRGVAVSVLLCGCIPPFEASPGATWKGERIQEYIAIQGSPQVVRESGDGKKEYEFRLDDACMLFFAVNAEGVIEDYRTQGWCDAPG